MKHWAQRLKREFYGELKKGIIKRMEIWFKYQKDEYSYDIVRVEMKFENVRYIFGEDAGDVGFEIRKQRYISVRRIEFKRVRNLNDKIKGGDKE